MALKEHPFVVTTSIPHDKKTITYDPTAPNRSTAVGKVYKINDDGKAELPADGEAFDGVIIAVDATQITAAYLFGGLRVLLANGETVKRGDTLVAGLGPSSAKGYVKAGSVPFGSGGTRCDGHRYRFGEAGRFITPLGHR